MATPRVRATLTGAWANVIGSASGVAGVTWQNIGGGQVSIAFTAAMPAGGASDAFHVLSPGEAFYDKTGSTACWACASSPGAILTATSD